MHIQITTRNFFVVTMRTSELIILNHNTEGYSQLYITISDFSYLYSICSGFGVSASVSNLALSRIAADILLTGGLTSGKSDEDIRELLKSAFSSTEKVYHTLIDNLLANKQQLQYEISDLSQYEISQNYQKYVDNLDSINKELSIGSSVLVGLITNKKLYISVSCEEFVVVNFFHDNLYCRTSEHVAPF